MPTTFQLPDMSCGHCVASITKAVHAADADAKLDFRLAQRELSVDSQELSREQLAALLSEAGYPPAAGA